MCQFVESKKVLNADVTGSSESYNVCVSLLESKKVLSPDAAGSSKCVCCRGLKRY